MVKRLRLQFFSLHPWVYRNFSNFGLNCFLLYRLNAKYSQVFYFYLIINFINFNEFVYYQASIHFYFKNNIIIQIQRISSTSLDFSLYRYLPYNVLQLYYTKMRELFQIRILSFLKRSNRNRRVSDSVPSPAYSWRFVEYNCKISQMFRNIFFQYRLWFRYRDRRVERQSHWPEALFRSLATLHLSNFVTLEIPKKCASSKYYHCSLPPSILTSMRAGRRCWSLW